MEKRTGGCHCKQVRYEVDIDLTKPVIDCNCSHCQIEGLLLGFVPRESITIVGGQDMLTEYRFNSQKIPYYFCKACGTNCFGYATNPEGVPMCAVNVRTIDDIDLSRLERMPYNGKDK